MSAMANVQHAMEGNLQGVGNSSSVGATPISDGSALKGWYSLMRALDALPHYISPKLWKSFFLLTESFFSS